MFDRETDGGKISTAGSDLFLGSMLAISVILFALGIACLVSPNPITVQPLTYTGNVVAVDTLRNSVTVQAGPNDRRTFGRTTDVAVLKCGDLQAWNGIKQGDKVAVSYYNRNGGKDIDVVALLPGKAEHC